MSWREAVEEQSSTARKMEGGTRKSRAVVRGACLHLFLSVKLVSPICHAVDLAFFPFFTTLSLPVAVVTQTTNLLQLSACCVPVWVVSFLWWCELITLD